MFCFRMREMIVTLQDVAMLLKLRMEGPLITGIDDKNLVMECERLLGTVLFSKKN